MIITIMIKLSTTRAAKKLGISPIALSRYIAKGKVPAPEIVKLGQSSIHLWTEEEIENVRKLLPKIANGRKTRYSKLREKQKAQPRAAVPHKSRKPKKKKSKPKP
jgi:predicted transcriptional regulator